MLLPGGQLDTAPAPTLPPEKIIVDGKTWVRTDIRKPADLINGEVWMEKFEEQCSEYTKRAPPRRMLRQTLSTGDEPRYLGQTKEPSATQMLPCPDRNQVLKTMAAPPCKVVRLATGEEVLFWFNVGCYPENWPLEGKVHVTAAHCPHQGVPLSTGELRVIEDIENIPRACVRCPRHNRLFDLQTGLGHGCDGVLPTFPAKLFREHGCFYVNFGPDVEMMRDDDAAHQPPLIQDQDQDHHIHEQQVEQALDEDAMQVDAIEEPALKKQCLAMDVSPAKQPVGPAVVKQAPSPARQGRALEMRHTTC